jgi:outer membrane receptor protein involved in Fe transport
VGFRLAVAALILLGAWPAAAQTSGAIAGRVRDASSNRPIGLARVVVDEGRQGAVTDTSGAYRVREVRSGWHRVRVELIGYVPYRRDSVLVRAGETTVLDVLLQPTAVTVPGVVVVAAPDPVLDPLVTADVQRVTAEEIRRFPVTTLEEAVALSAGSVGESYRGGRLGQQAFIIDGLGVKNGLDASNGPLGLRLPPDILTEAALVTNGFSARYGQAISGLINVVTKDGGDRWQGRAAYETDRPLWSGWDLGVDRLVLAADGPVPGGAGLAAVIDAEGRLDADPVNAPAPADDRDPRSDNPAMLPHNSGARVDAGLKFRLPLGTRNTLRLFGLRSTEQRLLFDPAYKYELDFAPARRVAGTLVTAHLQRATEALTADLRVGTFAREFTRGTLVAPPDFLVGAFPSGRFRFVGEALARAQDTAAARGAIPGFGPPDFSALSPWGVPAFFMGAGSRGEIAWNRYRDYRGQVDVSFAAGPEMDILVGGEVARQHVWTFQRVLGYLPVDSTVPPPTASNFVSTAGAGYLETVLRGADFAINLGVRYDRFSPAHTSPGVRTQTQHSINPRLAFSTALRGATVVASWGRFSQAPDLQYLTDAAFDDTLRTGRFRRGNPNLGFETATQYEFSVRARPTDVTSLRVNVFQKKLSGLVASVPLGVDPDSTIFGNLDFGTVRGAEVIFERELREWWGVRVAYTLQQAQATATDAFQLLRRVRIDPAGDTINPARVEFPLDYDRRHSVTAILQARGPDRGVLEGLEAAAIVRVATGLPYTKTNAAGDSLIGLPNSFRLPSQVTIDLLMRRSLTIAGRRASIYLDVRNLLNRRNIEAVRRDLGSPGPTDAIVQALADQAYQAHPEPIPYESPRYRPAADLDGNGLIDGPGELMPMYLAAARDYTQPLFAYGPPRVLRLGIELAL